MTAVSLAEAASVPVAARRGPVAATLSQAARPALRLDQRGDPPGRHCLRALRRADRAARPLCAGSDQALCSPPCLVRSRRRRSYLLGTDQLGRDLLSRIIHGARVTLLVSLFAVSFRRWSASWPGCSRAIAAVTTDLVITRLIDDAAGLSGGAARHLGGGGGRALAHQPHHHHGAVGLAAFRAHRARLGAVGARTRFCRGGRASGRRHACAIMLPHILPNICRRSSSMRVSSSPA